VAKIEKPEAVAALEQIVNAFDAIMVARGDLGVELPLDQVPLVQKRCVQLGRELAKPVIVATQMLDSMIENSRPTRAEASDVANAVLDGADAVMLSGETSVGRYPVLTVSTMAKIIETTETGSIAVPRLQHDPRTRGGALTSAASNIARAISAKALVAFSQTGDTVRRLARLHCELPLLALTPEPAVRNQLALSWGVQTYQVPFVHHTDDMFRQVDKTLLEVNVARAGDYVVVVAGSPPNTPGSTNTLRVHQLGSLTDSR
jgi:pyruvate kinase